MPDALLAADGIGKRYGRRDVLVAGSLWAQRGRITAMLGRNGAGKSTLLRIAAGWLRPDYGIVIFAGRRHTRPHLAALARLGLFYLPDRSLLCAFRTIDQHLAAVGHALGAPAVARQHFQFSREYLGGARYTANVAPRDV